MKPTVASFVFSLLLVAYHSAVTQDLIVTKDQDSIKCKITSIVDNRINFSFTSDGQTLDSYLSFADISDHKYDYLNPVERRVRFSLDLGLSQRTAKTHEDIPFALEDYMQDLKSGTNYAVSISTFFSESSGIGIKWSTHSSRANDGLLNGSSVNDHMLINYIGPYYSTRIANLSKKNIWYFNAGLGYLGYTNNGKFVTNYSIKGQTIGLNLDMGHDFMLSDKFALGFQASFVIGALTEVTDGSRSIELEEEDRESLNRLDLTFGLRFY